MSTSFEFVLCEHVLYRGENKPKWGKRSVSVGRSLSNDKHLLKVQQTQHMRSLWKLKKCIKQEIVELMPHSHAVVYIDELGSQRDVIGLLQLGNSCLASHYFTSDSKQVLTNLEAKLIACCDAASYKVEIEAQQRYPNGTAFLHIFKDRICLSKKQGFEFNLLGQWKIYSHKQLFAVQGGVMLMNSNEEIEDSLLVLKTISGHDICSKFDQRICELGLTVPRHLPYDTYYGGCDNNFNFALASSNHEDGEQDVLNIYSNCDNYLCWDKLRSLNQGNRSLSLSDVSFQQSISVASEDTSLRNQDEIQRQLVQSKENHHCQNKGVDFPESNSLDSSMENLSLNASAAQCIKHDVEMSTFESREKDKNSDDLEAVDHFTLCPPPIPQRPQKPRLSPRKRTFQIEQQQQNNGTDRTIWKQNIKVNTVDKGNKPSMDDFLLPRSRSFEIVQQTRVGKLQRHKSDPSILKKIPITELVQPVDLECVPGSDKMSVHCLPSNGHTSKDMYIFKSVSTVSIGNCGEYSSGMVSEAINHDCSERNECNCLMKKGIDTEGCCNKRTANDDHSSSVNNCLTSDVHCPYTNLPKPSCYLYMNLPDTRKAPKESPLYVNHVFMGSSIKGCYENWAQHFGEDFAGGTMSTVENKSSTPEPPAPPLKPRRPPPRVPARRKTSKNATSMEKERLEPSTIETFHSCISPPPRPAKRPQSSVLPYSNQKSDAKDFSRRGSDNIELQVAVFASKAYSGQVWFLRIVVMRHDSDDATFKVVMEREAACNYHLLQTQPFNISSDIVVSLHHKCPLFELRTDDSQEIDYTVVENLTPGFWFVIEFHLQHMGTARDQFVGSIGVEPKDLPPGGKCPINRKINLGIMQEFELKKPCSCVEGSRTLSNSEGSPPPHHSRVISDYTQRRKVCQKLDLTLYSQHNWRDVAGLLGFCISEIHQMEDKALRSVFFSPMDNVLSMWEQKDPACSLTRLVRILQQIKRFDVLSDLGFATELDI